MSSWGQKEETDHNAPGSFYVQKGGISKYWGGGDGAT